MKDYKHNDAEAVLERLSTAFPFDETPGKKYQDLRNGLNRSYLAGMARVFEIVYGTGDDLLESTGSKTLDRVRHELLETVTIKLCASIELSMCDTLLSMVEDEEAQRNDADS